MPSALPPPVQLPVLVNAETFTLSEMGKNRVTRSEKTLGVRSRQLSEGKEGIRMQRQSLTTSYKQTDATPVSKQWLPWNPFPSPFFPVLQFLLLSMVILYSTTLFPPWVPAQSSAHPRVFAGQGQQALMLCQHCSAVAKTRLCFQHLFLQTHKSKAQNLQLPC